MTILSSVSRSAVARRSLVLKRIRTTISCRCRYLSTSSIPTWATVNPESLGQDAPHAVLNLVNGQWTTTASVLEIPHPLDKSKGPIFTVPDTNVSELSPFMDSLGKIPKSGVHNPLKENHRYLEYGEISRKAADALSTPHVADFFAKCIQACIPKSYAQAMGEVSVTAAFLKNFGGDNVRRLAKSFGVAGDHYGQMSVGHRWPYGAVAIITPFNFPLEIPVLQLMGALYMGNKPVLKPSEPVSIVMEQYLHLLQHCGMDLEDVDMLNGKGPVAQELICNPNSPIRLTQFTGSSRVGELLAHATNGKIKLEDAGFDWKILGPDVDHIDYVAWQCDQDAYAASGQKCSAQSILFCHENWKRAGLLELLQKNASTRNLQDLSVGPVLTHTTANILQHLQNLLTVKGSELLFGGVELEHHTIPETYGAVEPTAVYVPLEEMLSNQETFDLCTTELFAPFQVVTTYNDDTLDLVLEACERMSHHLTAAVVSSNVDFQTKVLAHTVNGTTYTGRRARTTGAPQNHWFGPAGDPRGAGIGTPEAIQYVWSCHREVIHDDIVPADWNQPKAT